MKKLLVIVSLILCSIVLPVQQSNAQVPVLEIIKQAVTKVIKAVDLKIQRLQNKTIWLQNTQKVLENKMSALKLTEISDWIEKQRKLYADYFDELWKVKAALANYHRIKEIIQQQLDMVEEYKAAWALFRKDKNFTADELEHIQEVYHGMMDESVKNIDQLMLILNAFAIQMTDAKRLEVINQVSDHLNVTLSDLRAFNHQNKLISLQRAAERGEIETVKKLYGL
ncbi:conjugal transfer protein TraI [Terrimonas alba]|uniref:conjugal transfer protein TraI n=1 Tax=Terrimonas alba TaxID=3349636 RepID=UPI0035F34EA1